jgi:hypothetical protein
MTWTKVECLRSPPERYEHSAVIATRNQRKVMLILFGSSNDRLMDDIWSFDLQDYTWTYLETTGEVPLSRTLHSCVSQDNSIFIYGGGCYGDIPVADTAVYRLELGN